MATDPTTAEKAERLGLRQGEFSGGWCLPGHVYTDREIDALYAERFPTPDYRAALERLVDVAEQIENAGPGHEDWGALTKAIALARKVLHGQ